MSTSLNSDSFLAAQRSVDAAEGWLLLGCPKEALSELSSIKTKYESLQVPTITIYWQAYFDTRQFSEAVKYSQMLVGLNSYRPELWISHANTVRALNGIPAAKKVLQEARKRFEDNWLVNYNLACFEAQLGNINEAYWLMLYVFKLKRSQNVKILALADPDLLPLWKALGELQLRTLIGRSVFKKLSTQKNVKV